MTLFSIVKKKALVALCLVLLSSFYPLKLTAEELWVGETYECDAQSSMVGSITDVSWTTNGGYFNLSGAGYFRKVTATQYWSGTASVTCSWRYTLYYGGTQYTDSKTWYFTCRENPVSISPTSMTLNVGEYGRVTYSHEIPNSYTSYANVYFSCNSSCVSVTSTGYITALSPGTAYVHVYSNLSDASNSPYCTVTVLPGIDPTSASVSPSTKTIDMDETIMLTLVVNPSNATVTSQSWKSKDSSIASVNQSTGAVTGVSEGETEIYCIVNGTITSSSCKVTVKKPNFTLVSTYPSNSSTGQSLFTWPSLTFCRDIYESDAFSKITIKDPEGKAVDGATLINGATIIFMPTNSLETNTKYTMSFPANAVKDKYGTGNATQSLTFTTGAPQVVTPKVYLLVIEFIDGTNASFSLSKKPLLTFADHKLCVSVEGQMSVFELSDVENFHFVEETSGINTPKSEDDITIIWQGDDRVIISGADLSPKVCLYDIESKYYPNRITVIGNLSEVSLSYLPKGIYLLKINNQRTLKIIRK